MRDASSVARVEDRRRITDILIEFARALDRAEARTIAGVLGPGSWNGLSGQEIAEFLSENLILDENGTPSTAHQVSNVVVTMNNAEEAIATSDIAVFHKGHRNAPVRPVAVIRAEDTLRRSGGEWAMTQRGTVVLLGDTSSYLRQEIAPSPRAARQEGDPGWGVPLAVESIERLNAEYVRTIDRGDFAAFSRLFAHGRWNDQVGPRAIQDWLKKWVISMTGCRARTTQCTT